MNQKVFLAGHNGMVGSSVLGLLKSKGYKNIVTKNRSEIDLLNQNNVLSFFKKEKFDSVILCAAKVGGIMANNSYRADFIYENLQLSLNIIKASQETNVNKLINLGSSCIYPKNCKIPINEELLLSGFLEKTNEPYAIAKIAALKLCEAFYDQYGSNFYSIMPCNLYGPKDNFDLKTSHVLPALINKIHSAKTENAPTVSIWGTGQPMREFLYVDDLAKAVVFCLENVDAENIYKQGISHINCGSDNDISIADLCYLIKDIIGYQGGFIFDDSKPDGTFRKKMDNSRMKSLGFKPDNALALGIKKTYNWYLVNQNS